LNPLHFLGNLILCFEKYHSKHNHDISSEKEGFKGNLGFLYWVSFI